MNGEHWTLVSLKEVLVAGGASSRVNPDCVVGYWCNGPTEFHYQVQRYHGQIPSDLLRPDVWTYMDGWDETISSCAIRYAAHVSVYATGMTLTSLDHVAMRGIGLLELNEDPEVELQLKLETSIVLPRISTNSSVTFVPVVWSWTPLPFVACSGTRLCLPTKVPTCLSPPFL